MKAIICPKYGSPDVLQLREMVKPVPQEDEVLIQIHAASLNSRDLRMLRANPFFMRLMPGGLFRPKNKILGADVAGQVEAMGSNVKQFKPGDEVFGYLPSATGRGTFAEYVCANAKAMALKPDNLTFEQAAAVPVAAMTALQGLRDNGNIQPGQKVLINGASGGVGTFAVQIAKVVGAEVTAVCSTRNMDMARSIGADHIIDYTREDFTRNGQHYDLILAVNGYHPTSDYLRALSPDGIYVVAGGSMLQLFQAARQGRWASKTGSRKTYVVSLMQSQKDLVLIKELLESRKVVPVIDGCYPLSKTAEAFRYFEKVHAKGKVVIIVEQQDEEKNEKDLYNRNHFDSADSLHRVPDSGGG
jgi:NADPH:quinone reductase-like Zn-dependent oxidoreductase